MTNTSLEFAIKAIQDEARKPLLEEISRLKELVSEAFYEGWKDRDNSHMGEKVGTAWLNSLSYRKLL